MNKLTKRQKYVLQKLADGGDIVFSAPGGWWLGVEQIGGKTPMALLRGCALHLDYEEHDNSYAIYTINETGRNALESNSLLTGQDIRAMVEAQKNRSETQNG